MGQQAARAGVLVSRHLAPLPAPDDRRQGHAAARQVRVQNGQKGREACHQRGGCGAAVVIFHL